MYIICTDERSYNTSKSIDGFNIHVVSVLSFNDRETTDQGKFKRFTYTINFSKYRLC